MNKIRKKCKTCGKTQVVPIEQEICGLHKTFNTPPCTGTLGRFSGDMDDAILNLIAVANEINKLHQFKESELLTECIEDLETWIEYANPPTPREMGWVGDDGLP